MKIQMQSIQLDPNQPRKIIEETSVQNLAKSMNIEGLIHPIEVDINHMIIVGEMRYRAATLLGWTEIEANINKKELSPYERLRRQMGENLQQSGAKGGGQPMNSIDTANAWARLIGLKRGKDWWPGRESREDTYGMIKAIAQEVGVIDDTIHEYLILLEQPKYVIEDMLKGRPRTYYREAEKAPQEVKEDIKKKIAEGGYKNREEIIRDIAIAKKVPELQSLIVSRRQDKESKEANRILNAISILSLALIEIPLSKISAKEQSIIHGQLEWMKQKIEDYLQKEVTYG